MNHSDSKNALFYCCCNQHLGESLRLGGQSPLPQLKNAPALYLQFDNTSVYIFFRRADENDERAISVACEAGYVVMRIGQAKAKVKVKVKVIELLHM